MEKDTPEQLAHVKKMHVCFNSLLRLHEMGVMDLLLQIFGLINEFFWGRDWVT